MPARPPAKTVARLRRVPAVAMTALLSVVALSSGAAAQRAELTQDINRLALPGAAEISEITRAAGQLYFRRCDRTHGCELWASDGTDGSARLVRDIRSGVDGSNPGPIYPGPRGVFLLADEDQDRIRYLWFSDGTEAGTDWVASLRQGQMTRTPSVTAACGELFFFRLSSLTGEWELWRSDGTRAGTHPVWTGFQGSWSEPFSCLNAQLFFFANHSASRRSGLWRSDGTERGTALVAPASAVSPPAVFGGSLFFLGGRAGSAAGLWRTDGTDQGTTLVYPFLYLLDRDRLGLVGQRLLVSLRSAGSFGELWTSDGTPTGTVPFLSGVAADGRIVSAKEFTLFSRSAGIGRDEIWRTDGSSGGTYRLAPAEMREATEAGGRVFFVGSDELGQEVWTSDGTALGTRRVKDIAPGAASSDPRSLTALDSRLFFRACPAAERCGLWRSDGTEQGTQEVPSRNLSTRGSNPREFTAFRDRLFFSADDGVTGAELWSSDGSGAGTALLADLVPGGTGSSPESLGSAGDWLYFFTSGCRLWRTIGKPGQAAMIKDLSSVASCTSNGSPMDLAGAAVFSVGFRIWRSDGSAEGTFELARTTTDPLKAFDGKRSYFGSWDEVGKGLWTTDGTPTGTRRVAYLPRGFENAWVCSVIRSARTVLFSVDDAWGLQEMFVSDGSEQGTRLFFDWPHSFTVSNCYWGPAPQVFVGDRTLFLAHEPGIRSRLWVSDGTPGGTFPLTGGGRFGSSLRVANMISTGKLAFLLADDDETGFELWASDGTVLGTRRVADIRPGPVSSQPFILGLLDGRLLFRANDGTHGEELWISDGTPRGTGLLADIEPGSGGSSPREVHRVGDLLFVAATTEPEGEELWAIKLGANPSLR